MLGEGDLATCDWGEGRDDVRQAAAGWVGARFTLSAVQREHGTRRGASCTFVLCFLVCKRRWDHVLDRCGMMGRGVL